MYYLGLDAGSASASLALINEDLQLVGQRYLLLKGVAAENKELIRKEMKELTSGIPAVTIAVSGSGAEQYALPAVNEISALSEGARYIAPQAKSVMEIGAESSKYITGLQKDHIQFALNDNCSAGTGSFFEAQMQRLNLPLEDYSELVSQAKSIPRIAGRCSVFAKTDIIHSQQAGVSIEDILLGLCYAVVRNYRASVAGKLSLEKPVLLSGGTALNDGVVAAIRDIFKLEDTELLLLPESPLVTALGVAILAKRQGREVLRDDIDSLFLKKPLLKKSGTALPPLRDPRVDLDALQTVAEYSEADSYYLGIDIGSTSTNLVLLNEDDEVVDFQYLRTKGDPRAAVQNGFASLAARFGQSLKIKGLATTGSGRHYIGELVGADTVQDEITSQATAAAHFRPEVDTVMEIGGQDSKYIQIGDGLVRNFEMNKICAAGTGAFIEEQAAKLAIAIDDYGELALRANAPLDLGDRCTVLIESSINANIADGVSKEDIAAGLCYSIVSNYVNRVVGDRPVGDHILLLGGVAYNPGIVAAFKQRYGDRIEVGHYFNVNGAVGAALLAKEKLEGRKTRFKGLSCLNEAAVDLLEQVEEPQKPEDKQAVFAEETPRDPEKETIGIPRALYNYNLIPVFQAFFQGLGYNVLISKPSDEETVSLGQANTQTELCFPVKLAIGHAAELVEQGVDYLVIPSVISTNEHVAREGPNCACVYMQSAPSMIAQAMRLEEHQVRLLAPVLDLAAGADKVLDKICQLGIELGRSRETCEQALREASKKMKGGRGRQAPAAPDNLENGQKPRFVMIARGYCAKDDVLSQRLREMIQERGYEVLMSKQLLSLSKTEDVNEQDQLYWPFATHALESARTAAKTKNLYVVYLTYHGCGPDTMISHWLAEEMGEKPYLHIEVDEHSSNVGLITRIDAFINSVQSHLKKSDGRQSEAEKTTSRGSFHDDVSALRRELPVLLPALSPYSELLASYLEGQGYQVVELEASSKESVKHGRLSMRGKEHYTLSTLLGSVALAIDGRPDGQVLYPQNDGAEVDGLYAYFVYRKLADHLSFVSPNLTDPGFISTYGDTLLRILVAGDLALASDDVGLLTEMRDVFRASLPDDGQLIRWAKRAQSDEAFLFVLGEPACIFDALFQKTIIEKAQEEKHRVRYMPLAELALFEWQDKADPVLLRNMQNLLTSVSDALGTASVYSQSVSDLAGMEMPFLISSGGHAAYRHRKSSFRHEKLLGIVAAASQHENTASILELASAETSKPLLRLSFDGSDDPVNRLKMDTFLYEISKSS